MLTVGITIMVAAIAVGATALSLAALMSSSARSAGSRTRIAMGLSPQTDHAPDLHRAGEGAPYYEEDAPGQAAEGDAAYYEEDAPYEPAEADAPASEREVEGPPRLVLALAILSGAGLVLGLFTVMIASIP